MGVDFLMGKAQVVHAMCSRCKIQNFQKRWKIPLVGVTIIHNRKKMGRLAAIPGDRKVDYFTVR